MVRPTDLVYVIQRFDRAPGERIHVEDFAQVADVEPMFKYSESGASYDSLAAAIRQLTGDEGYHDFIARLAALLIVGNTDGHLKNWAIRYADGRTPRLAPVYDFHSISVYSTYRWAPLALSLDGETVPSAVTGDHFRRLAERVGADPEQTFDTVAQTVARLRSAWNPIMAGEALLRFDALADHYTERLSSLTICNSDG
ncbi:HipA domain-containing protein [Micromonospora sp. ALFpr18c]|uniref:HipA domain-containing protein n=1 Tax=Micromonospora sp. ALFpr18c TaxID=1458665 RepID=UPI001788C082|nr:HipA domain-containing protein [Micromonospora sp. ALFpr18c]